MDNKISKDLIISLLISTLIIEMVLLLSNHYLKTNLMFDVYKLVLFVGLDQYIFYSIKHNISIGPLNNPELGSFVIQLLYFTIYSIILLLLVEKFDFIIKILINNKLKILIFLIPLLVFFFIFFYENIKFKNDLYQKCENIELGLQKESIVNIMGAPNNTFVKNGDTNLIYFEGGVQSEAGILFTFNDENILLDKKCGLSSEYKIVQ